MEGQTDKVSCRAAIQLKWQRKGIDRMEKENI